MAMVTWWLTTKTSSYSVSELWRREVEMGFLPHEGDHVLILTSEEEPDGSIGGYVKRRYWDFDGKAHLEFQEYVQDPPEDFKPNRIMTSWWTDRDGDLEEMLRASGWADYDEWTRTR